MCRVAASRPTTGAETPSPPHPTPPRPASGSPAGPARWISRPRCSGGARLAARPSSRAARVAGNHRRRAAAAWLARGPPPFQDEGEIKAAVSIRVCRQRPTGGLNALLKPANPHRSQPRRRPRRVDQPLHRRLRLRELPAPSSKPQLLWELAAHQDGGEGGTEAAHRTSGNSSPSSPLALRSGGGP